MTGDSLRNRRMEALRAEKGAEMHETGISGGGDNVFADLGLPEADERLAKAELAIRIEELIAARGLTQAQAAAVMGIAQPDVSNIVRGRLRGYPLERLVHCLVALDQLVEITVRPRDAGEDRARVLVTVSDAA